MTLKSQTKDVRELQTNVQRKYRPNSLKYFRKQNSASTIKGVTYHDQVGLAQGRVENVGLTFEKQTV